MREKKIHFAYDEDKSHVYIVDIYCQVYIYGKTWRLGL